MNKTQKDLEDDGLRKIFATALVPGVGIGIGGAKNGVTQESEAFEERAFKKFKKEIKRFHLTKQLELVREMECKFEKKWTLSNRFEKVEADGTMGLNPPSKNYAARRSLLMELFDDLQTKESELTNALKNL